MTINQWMTGDIAIAGLSCFLWGIASVMLSPCHIASIPLIIGYVGGEEKAVNSKHGASYVAFFIIGQFIIIVLAGVICTQFGRAVGDVGDIKFYWHIIIGNILIWISLGLFGVEKGFLSFRLLYRLKIRGFFGAFVLGIAYGIFSISCTFCFIVPIMAIITVQEKVVTGIMLILLFAMGYSLPIIFIGSFTAVVRKLLENNTWQGTILWFRKGAGVMIYLLGIYLMFIPFINS